MCALVTGLSRVSCSVLQAYCSEMVERDNSRRVVGSGEAKSSRHKWKALSCVTVCLCLTKVVQAFVLPTEVIRPSPSLFGGETRSSFSKRGLETRRYLLDFKTGQPPPLPMPETLTYDKKSTKSVTFSASRSAETEVTEGIRSLQDYMALPPSQYSVLDADAIVRLSDDSFRCQIKGINFFGYRLVPILYVKVVVDTVNRKSTLNVYKLELTGSRIADLANGTFEVKARNIVAYRDTPIPSNKVMISTVSVAVDALVPRGNIIPLHVLEKGGSLVIQGILNVMVPRFVKILARDYQKWAAGDDSRSAVAHELEENLSTAE